MEIAPLVGHLWGGSPATKEIQTGLESSENVSDEGQSEDQIPPTDTDELDTGVLTGEPDVSDGPNDPDDSSERNSGDTEELVLKKKMVEQMDNFEKQYCERFHPTWIK